MFTSTENLTAVQLPEPASPIQETQEQPAKIDHRHTVRESLTFLEAKFKLRNDVSLVYPLTEEIQQLVERIYGEYEESYRFQLAISLEESIANAMVHGNLEISSEFRLGDGSRYYDLVSERMNQPPYRDRQAHVEVTLGRDQLILVVRDEGPGFDVDAVPDPTATENLEKPSGRGLALMRSFMDAVIHNDAGNSVTMIKRPPKQP
jgi:two-component sensor histidine kinase